MDGSFPENELKEWAAFEPETLDRAVGEFDHGLSDVTNLAKKFEALLEEADDAVPGCICQQYNTFKFMINEKRKIGLLKSFSEIVTWSLKSEHFPDLVQLLDICGTFQASSTYCERGFRLEVFHLDQLVRIKSRQKETLDLDTVYNHWKGD